MLIAAFLKTDSQPAYVRPDLIECLARADEVCLTACGSSHHALGLARFGLTQHAGLPTRYELAHQLAILGPQALARTSLVILASQSGESYDTLRAMDVADAAGCATLALVSDLESTLAQRATFAWPTLSGVERAVPSTKGFLAQALLATLVGPVASRARGGQVLPSRAAHLDALPEAVQATYRATHLHALLQEKVRSATHLYLLGQGAGAAIAAEGALKLKETAYARAEAYVAGEFRHGPIAVLEESAAVLVLVHQPEEVPLARTLLRAMRPSGAARLLVRSEAVFGASLDGEADETLVLPEVGHTLAPLLSAACLQQLALDTALHLGRPIDAPRYLVKSVPAP